MGVVETEVMQPEQGTGTGDFADSLLQQFAGELSEDDAAGTLTPPELFSVLDGKYRLDRLLGRGGMGIVFRARNLMTGRPVAIKWMVRRGDLQCLRERFLREARAAGRIRQPNVVDIYDVVSSEQATYLVMELLDGESLRSRLRRGRCEPSEAVEVALAMLEGLAEAHRQHVIHRDLKPENVFLCGSPARDVKILDFGISVLNETQDVLEATLTVTGHFVGTPMYTALERLREKQPFDHRVDLYSVGVILYESLTGRLPFLGKTPSELTYQQTTALPPFPRALRPELSEQLEAVILKALARAPADRFDDAQTFKDVLRAVPEARSYAAKASGAAGCSAGTEVEKKTRLIYLMIVLAGVALLLMLVRAPTKPPPAITSSGIGRTASLARALLKDAQTRDAIVNSVPALQPRMTVPSRGELPSESLRVKSVPNRYGRSDGKRSILAVASPLDGAAARLTVVVFPYGDVWIDSKYVGAAPITVSLPAGRHVVRTGRTRGERETVVSLSAAETRELVLPWRQSSTSDGSKLGEPVGPANANFTGGEAQIGLSRVPADSAANEITDGER